MFQNDKILRGYSANKTLFRRDKRALVIQEKLKKLNALLDSNSLIIN